MAVRLERVTDPAAFLTQLRRDVDALAVSSEIIAVPADPTGFGRQLRSGLAQARGQHVLTVDPDVSGPMTFLADLWARRHDAEVIIASRYVDGSRVDMPAARKVGSRILNAVFRRGLSLGVNDGSSAIRLYRADVVNSLRLQATDYDILQEVLVRAFAEGWRVREIPFGYAQRPVASKAHASLALRPASGRSASCGSCATRSSPPTTTTARTTAAIPLQRYWQRIALPARHRADRRRGPGARRRLRVEPDHRRLPPGSVAVDVLRRKLRYARQVRTAARPRLRLHAAVSRMRRSRACSARR